MANIMTDITANLLFGAVTLSALAFISLVALRGWRDWIALKRDELIQNHATATHEDASVPHAGSRIEIADLKERLRKLEAIAAGVDL